jgi:hypothetical protein
VLLLPLSDLVYLLVDVLDGGGDVVELAHGPAVGVVVLAADAVEESGDDGGGPSLPRLASASSSGVGREGNVA